MKSFVCAAAVFAMALFAAPALRAESARQGLYLDQNVQAACNPIGAQLGTKLFYRLPLSEKKGILWESTKVDAGMTNTLSPAFDLVGAFLDIEPIAFFDLGLKAQFAGYFDSLGYGFRELDGYRSGFDSSALDDIDGRNASGCILSAAPTLQFAYGKLAFSDTLNLNYFNVDGGQGYFYEIIGNCPLAKRDLELENDAYLLWTLSPGLMLGLNESLLAVPCSGYRSQTLKTVGVINRPLSERLSFYAALLCGFYLEDRYLRYEPRAAGMSGLAYSF
jgi:hypothetical protein